jgi:folate-binding protein YgfZ
VELVFDSKSDRESFLEASGYELVSENWVQSERIEHGVPLIPAELGPGDLPGEAGLEKTAVSFTKGCFLGQEVVARMHNVGRPQRGLFRVSGTIIPESLPVSLTDEAGKAVGELRSICTRNSGWLGVAILKKRYAAVGSLFFAGEAEIKIDGVLGSERSTL